LRSATASVSFSSSRHVKSRDQKLTLIRYDLAHEAGGWKIDDIKGPTAGETWSVRNMLADSHKELR